MIDALALELHGQRRGLEVEIVDELKADVDVRSPRVGHFHAVKQLAAGVAEQIGDRAQLAERDQPGVAAVLQGRAVTDEVQPKPRRLAFAADARVL